MLESKWSVVVTTAPRENCTLNECVESLRICGWEPVIFAEPGSSETDAKVIINEQRLGVWHNWMKSCRWAIENTSAPIVMTVQDDSLFHPQSKMFIEPTLWPCKHVGFVSLYTPKHYSIIKNRVRNCGINRIRTRSLWGACALVWPREILSQVISHPIAKNWSGARPRSGNRDVIRRRLMNPHTIANSDTAIGKILNSMRRTMWFVDPSPVQHIARYSTISHGDNSGRRNAWRIADHNLPLAQQVPVSPITYVI